MKQLRRTPFVGVLVALTIAALAACASPAPANTEEPVVEFPAGSTMAKLAEAGEITVAVKFDAPPFGARDLSGNLEGFDIEVAKAIAAALGISEENINWIEATVPNRELFLQQGKVDMVIASYAINDERKEVVTFAGPYLTDKVQLAVQPGNPKGITAASDLNGLQVCALGNNVERLATAAPEAISVQFDNDTGCIKALQNGQIDAWLSGLSDLLAARDKDPSAIEIIDVDLPVPSNQYGIGLLKGDTEFCEFVDGVLEEAVSSGDYDSWVEDKLGVDATIPEFIPCA